jgi:hypothetical protein
MVLRTVGAAEGEKITAVGEAEAKVIKQKTAAMDPEKYASVEIARALAASGSSWCRRSSPAAVATAMPAASSTCCSRM